MAPAAAALTVFALLCATAVSAGRHAPQVSADGSGALMNNAVLRWQREGLQRQGRSLLHAGIDHGSTGEADAHAPEPAASVTTDAAGGGATINSGGRSYTWLKWVAAAVLFLEGLLGVLLPVLLKLTIHAGWLLSLVNCFAGAVFFSFGVLHLGPDALDAQSAIGIDRFPLAAFLIAVSFFVVFFLHRVLAPAMKLRPHLHSDVPAVAPKAAVVTIPAALGGSTDASPAGCGNCGPDCSSCGTDQCGCAGGVKAGTCGNGCQAGACSCAHKKALEPPSNPAASETLQPRADPYGTITAPFASAAAVSVAEVQKTERPKLLLRAVALLSPVLILLGILAHTVLEGLAIGLQKSYGDVVTAFVAMASHKWVESVALAAAFLAAGSSMLTVILFLLPFSLGPLVGIAIGVSVSNTSAWVVMVLFALVAGLFIYVGSVGIVSEEFAKFEDPDFAATRPRFARFYLFGALVAGFTVVALLQLVPEG